MSMASASTAGQQLPTPAAQQELVVEESEEGDIITVDDERPQALPPVVDKRTSVMTKTGSDGTIRIRRQPNGAATPAAAAGGSKVEENEKVVGVFSGLVVLLNPPVKVCVLC